MGESHSLSPLAFSSYSPRSWSRLERSESRNAVAWKNETIFLGEESVPTLSINVGTGFSVNLLI